MQKRLLDWLACSRCTASALTLQVKKAMEVATFTGSWGQDEVPGRGESPRVVEEIMEGALRCEGCGALYPIREGVPRMLPDPTRAGPSSGHRWTRFDGQAPEYEANFEDMTRPLGPLDYLGQWVLDAGCGFGRHAYFAARYGAEVIALDSSSDAVASAWDNCRGLERVHVIQGDLYTPPLRPHRFDRVLSLGVLHHLPEPRRGFGALGRMVRPGGTLQVWVYGPRQGAVALVSGALHGWARALPDDQLHAFCVQLARGLRVFSHTPYRLTRHIPGLGTLTSHLPNHDHHRWPFDVVVADIYDRLRVPVTEYIKGEELEDWFGEEGYLQIEVTRRVRNNESFRGIGTRRS